jgi:hypothetical protein
MKNKSTKKSITEPKDYSFEELITIFNTQADKAKIWLNDNGFIPENKKEAVKFEQEIEGLTLDPAYPGALFWSTVYIGIMAYQIVNETKEFQKRNPKDRERYAAKKLARIYKDIWSLMKIGVIEPVTLRTILPLKQFVSPEHKNPGKPINALATNMALDLLDLCKFSKKGASDLVCRFLCLYFPNEEIDTENIRRNLYREKFPTSDIRSPVQKGKAKSNPSAHP